MDCTRLESWRKLGNPRGIVRDGLKEDGFLEVVDGVVWEGCLDDCVGREFFEKQTSIEVTLLYLRTTILMTVTEALD